MADRFRTHLIKLASHSTHPRYRHAAILARGKRILSKGWNSDFLHAETHAIRVASHSVHGASLYTLMVKKAGELGNGSPCPECMDALRAAGIRKVVVYL
jgi:pyrimidine deaminase RibD-like protein